MKEKTKQDITLKPANTDACSDCSNFWSCPLVENGLSFCNFHDRDLKRFLGRWQVKAYD